MQVILRIILILKIFVNYKILYYNKFNDNFVSIEKRSFHEASRYGNTEFSPVSEKISHTGGYWLT